MAQKDLLIAQGFQNFNQGLGEGLKQFISNKRESEFLEGAFQGIVSQRKQMGMEVDPQVLGKFSSGGLGAKRALVSQLGSENQFQMQQKGREELLRREHSGRINLEAQKQKLELEAQATQNEQANTFLEKQLGITIGDKRNVSPSSVISAFNANIAKKNADKPGETLGELQTREAELRGAGDTKLANEVADLINKKTKFANSSETVYDSEGNPIFTRTTGDGPTVATKGKIEERLINSKKAINEMEALIPQIDNEFLGLRGLAGEVIFDKLLGNFAPEVVNDKRVDFRTKLRVLIQGMVRQISSDTRFTNEDRQRAEAALPSTGILTNAGEARQSLETLVGIFRRRNIEDLSASNKLNYDSMDEKDAVEAFYLGYGPDGTKYDTSDPEEVKKLRKAASEWESNRKSK